MDLTPTNRVQCEQVAQILGSGGTDTSLANFSVSSLILAALVSMLWPYGIDGDDGRARDMTFGHVGEEFLSFRAEKIQRPPRGIGVSGTNDVKTVEPQFPFRHVGLNWRSHDKSASPD